MRLRHDVLERELERLGWQKSKAQRILDPADIAFEADETQERRALGRGALMGAAVSAPLAAFSGPLWPAVVAAGAAVGAGTTWLISGWPWSAERAAIRTELEAGQTRLQGDLAHARQVLATALPDPEDDGALLRALRGGAVEIDGPGMATMLKQRIEARAAGDAVTDAADAAARAERVRKAEDERRLDRARAFRDATP